MRSIFKSIVCPHLLLTSGLVVLCGCNAQSLAPPVPTATPDPFAWQPSAPTGNGASASPNSSSPAFIPVNTTIPTVTPIPPPNRPFGSNANPSTSTKSPAAIFATVKPGQWSLPDFTDMAIGVIERSNSAEDLALVDAHLIELSSYYEQRIVPEGMQSGGRADTPGIRFSSVIKLLRDAIDHKMKGWGDAATVTLESARSMSR
jgi:hypothetical protein